MARAYRLAPIDNAEAEQRTAIDQARARYLLELAWDGHRVLATRVGDDVRIASADFQPWHQVFAAIAIALRRLPADQVVIEGHLCALDEKARPQFDRLRRFVTNKGGEQIALACTDLLRIDGEDICDQPLTKRRARLAALLSAQKSDLLIFSAPLDGPLDRVLAALDKLDLRGIVARPLDQPYRCEETAVAIATNDREVTWDRSLSPAPTVTNADKVLYPRDDLTKTNIAAYYRDVAEVMLPHFAKRPIVGQRWPDGIDDFTWFQHRVPPRAPDYLKPVMIEGNRRIVVSSKEAMLWLVNQAVITFHSWASRVGSLNEPDWALLDLDPGEDTTWEQTIAVALAVRRLLELLELPSVVKTSGQRGMHVLIPIASGHSPQQAHDFAEGLSAMIQRLMPDVVSLDPRPDVRAGRLYLDHLQSFVGKALVMSYSLRATDGAPVSTPIAWEEVTPELDPRSFTIKTLRDRLDKHGDLAAPLLSGSARLSDALSRLG